MDELEETMGLGILGTVLRDAAEDGFGMVLHYRELDEVCAVEHNVGSLLEGIYPLTFCAEHVFPVGDGFTGRVSAFVVIPYDAPEEAVVGSGDPIVVVKLGCSEGIDENAELGAFGDVGSQTRIERMDTFDEEDASGAQFERFPVILPESCNEVEFWNGYLLSADEFHDVRLHEGMVHGIEIVEVVCAVREFGSVGPVHEIIVSRHGDGLQTAGLELDGKPLAEGRFA